MVAVLYSSLLAVSTGRQLRILLPRVSVLPSLLTHHPAVPHPPSRLLQSALQSMRRKSKMSSISTIGRHWLHVTVKKNTENIRFSNHSKRAYDNYLFLLIRCSETIEICYATQGNWEHWFSSWFRSCAVSADTKNYTLLLNILSTPIPWIPETKILCRLFDPFFTHINFGQLSIGMSIKSTLESSF